MSNNAQPMPAVMRQPPLPVEATVIKPDTPPHAAGWK
jgi:hypothetical protein